MVNGGKRGRSFICTVFVLGLLATVLPGCSSVNSVVTAKKESAVLQSMTFEPDTETCHLEWNPVSTKILTDTEAKRKKLDVPLGNYWALEWKVVNNCPNSLSVSQKNLTITGKNKEEYLLGAKDYVVKNKVVDVGSLYYINPRQKYNVIMYYDMPLGAKPSKDYKVGITKVLLFSSLDRMTSLPGVK